MMKPVGRFLERFEPVPGRARVHPVRNTLVTIVFVVVLVYGCFTRFAIPFLPDDTTTLRAEFSDSSEIEAAQGLRHGEAVRVNGVDVGVVRGIELNPERETATVTMEVNDSVSLRSDARAAIRWRLLLGGNHVIALDPGSASEPPLGDTVIPSARTTSQVQWDDLFQPYDGVTAQRQKIFFREMRAALDDRRAVGAAIEALAPTLTTVGRGVRPYRGQESDDLARLVASTARTTAALTREHGALERVVDGAAVTLSVTARRRAEIGETLERSPASMDAAVRAFADLRGILDQVDPIAADLRPAARRLAPAIRAASPALRQIDGLLAETKPLLRPLRTTFAGLRRFGTAAPPVLRSLRPTAGRMRREILPLLAEVDPDTKRPAFQMIGPTFAVTDSAASDYDASGHILHFPNKGDERTAGLPCQTFFTDPTAEQKLRCDNLSELIQMLLDPPGNG